MLSLQGMTILPVGQILCRCRAAGRGMDVDRFEAELRYGLPDPIADTVSEPQGRGLDDPADVDRAGAVVPSAIPETSFREAMPEPRSPER